MFLGRLFRARRRGSEVAPADRPPLTREERAQRVELAVPTGMRIAGDWSWRLLAVSGVLALFVFLVIQLRLIVIPFMVAILLAALLVPLVKFLQRHGWKKGLAVAVAELGLIAIVSGLIVLVVLQIRAGFPDLQERSMAAYQQFRVFLRDSPLAISDADFNRYVDDIVATVQRDSSGLLSGALDIGSTAGHFLAGILLTLFATLFMLIDGRGIWNWVVRLFPRRARRAVDGSGNAGWVTLTSFVRVQILVAAVDAVGIGLGAFILGLFFGGFPLVIPISIAVFLGSFVPVVGAVLSGTLAIAIALVYLNPFAAVLMLGIVLLVQQIEGHVLQPFIMGVAVKVHPLAVVLAVATGGFLAGIPGALFAVPVVATVNVMINYMASGAWRSNPDPDEKDLRMNPDVPIVQSND